MIENFLQQSLGTLHFILRPIFEQKYTDHLCCKMQSCDLLLCPKSLDQMIIQTNEADDLPMIFDGTLQDGGYIRARFSQRIAAIQLPSVRFPDVQ